MGERKVLNKYYPPDFDPAKLPRARQPKNKQMNIRMMLPMSIRCNTCGNYIYKGTKFNSRKEDCEGEKYLGIQIFRFYFKCTRCSAELAMKTDPQNSDYTMESGASRNFEPWRAEDEQVDKEQRKRDAEEMGDAMKSLENRTLDSKREMDILAALDEMKSMKSRHATVSVDEMLEAFQRTAEEKEEKWEEEDEALIKSMVFPGSKDYVRRINDDDIDDDDDDGDDGETSRGNLKKIKVSEEVSVDPVRSSTTASTTYETSKIEGKVEAPLASNNNEIIIQSSSVRISFVKRPNPASKLKKSDANNQTDVPNLEKSNKEKEGKTSTNTSTGLQSLLQNYESDEDD